MDAFFQYAITPVLPDQNFQNLQADVTLPYSSLIAQIK
jgi:hypothetical protein